MLQRMSDQHKIKFTEKVAEEAPVEIRQEDWARSPDTMEDQKSKKLNNSEVIDSVRSANSVLSAGGGSIKDNGGPSKYIGSSTQNSIWDTDIVEKLSETKSNKEKTLEAKEHIQNVRKNVRKESLDNLTKALEHTDTRKSSDVQSLSELTPTQRKASPNNLSIFDTEVFDNMPEKTAGEKIAEAARAEKDVDDSWRGTKGTLKSTDIVNNLFDKLMSGR